jgi:hypothetical protein
MGFALDVTELGFDDDGDPITTLVARDLPEAVLALLGIRSYLLMSRQPEFGAAVAGIAI